LKSKSDSSDNTAQMLSFLVAIAVPEATPAKPFTLTTVVPIEPGCKIELTSFAVVIS